MKVRIQLERIEIIHRLIDQRRTGRPEELARRLGLSVSRLARIIEYLRAEGAPIAYDRSLQTYFYTHRFEIDVSLRFQRKDK